MWLLQNLPVVHDKVSGDGIPGGVGGGLTKTEAYLLSALTIIVVLLAVTIISYVIIRMRHKPKNHTRSENEKETEFCRFCGKEIENDSRYCKHCGEKLE